MLTIKRFKRLYDTDNHVNIGRTYLNLGICFDDQQKFAKAESSYLKAMNIFIHYYDNKDNLDLA